MFIPRTSAVIVESHYFPSVEYLSLFTMGNKIVLEQHENYQKSSFRNRTTILDANGPLTLSIPLDKGKHQQTPIMDVGISYATAWNRTHFKAIQSAYGKSPFFIHYVDELKNLFESTGNSLWNFNLKLLKFLLKNFNLQTEVSFTESYEKSYHKYLDFRGALKPGMVSKFSESVPYEQVFSDKYGFVPGLSALDLLMCQGPYGVEVLKEVGRKWR